MKASFQVQNKLGNSLQEKYYQRAMEDELTKEKIKYQSQRFVAIRNNNGSLGNYFIDLVVEKKVVVEIKAKPIIIAKDIHQVLAYLALTIGTPRVTFKRIINSSISAQ